MAEKAHPFTGLARTEFLADISPTDSLRETDPLAGDLRDGAAWSAFSMLTMSKSELPLLLRETDPLAEISTFSETHSF